MAKEKTQTKKQESSKKDKKIVIVPTRGRTFEGTVTKKFPNRVVIEFERTFFVRKFDRFAKKKTRIHARLPAEMVNSINVGDYIQVRECRPLSKIIHFIVTSKIRSASAEEAKQ